MLKKTQLLLTILLHFTSSAQDITDIFKYPDGSRQYKVCTKKDTVLVCTYPNGKKESQRQWRNNAVNGLYTRWYENGKVMWKKEMKKNVVDGKALYYNKKGLKVAELKFKNGKVTDTIFVLKGQHLVLGKITYSTKVVGGMQNEDGSANISEHSGVYANCSMYATQHSEKHKPKFISGFRSDVYGEFMLLLPEGQAGFYPTSVKIESLAPGKYEAPQHLWNSGHEGWSVKSPLDVKKGDKLLFVELHHSSMGYAP